MEASSTASASRISVSSKDTINQIGYTLADIPSYELKNVTISGHALKLIGERLKGFDIELDQILPISKAGLYRQFKKDDIDLVLKDNLVGITQILNKGVAAFGDQPDFQEWLVSRIENLGNRRPLDLLALQTGRREVERALDRIEYGVYG